MSDQDKEKSISKIIKIEMMIAFLTESKSMSIADLQCTKEGEIIDKMFQQLSWSI